LFKSTIFKGNPVPFVLELPVYRMPSAKTVFIHLRGKVRDFLVRAFTIIFVGSLAIWFLTNLDWSFSLVDDGARSIPLLSVPLSRPFSAPMASLPGRPSRPS
jgi:ferrous iron transport protein B